MMPNVIAGLLIGIANTSWVTVLGASVGWGIIFVVFSVLRGSPWIAAAVDKGIERMGWGTTRACATALTIEFVTATITAALVGSPTYLIKGWVIS